MSSLALFYTIAGAHLLAVMSPGPDFAMVTRQTLAAGRRAGLLTAWGIATGIVFHVGWGLFGLGWLLERIPALLDTLRYAGAAFLLWMGVNALRAQPLPAVATAAPVQATHRHFITGLLTNLLNPKAGLFFVTLFAAALSGNTPVTLRLALGAWIVLSTGLWFSLVALSLGHPAVQQRLRSVAHWLDRGMGLLLIGLALAMVVA